MCDLCGFPLVPPEVSDEEAAGNEPAATEVTAAVPQHEAAPAPVVPSGQGFQTGIYCNACGWKNPPGARFCSQCGAPLQQVATAPRPPETPPPVLPPSSAPTQPSTAAGTAPGAIGRRMGIIVGASALLVVALFLITVVSKQRAIPAAPPAPAASQGVGAAGPVATPLPAEQARQAAALEAEIERLDGPARLEKQRELVRLLLEFGRPDHAAPTQRAIAEADGSAEAWRQAGDLYFAWMEGVPEAHRAQLAAEVIDAYRKVLELEPDNLDVRADLAWAYQYDARNPMAAIEETQAVLERDPDHVQANFYRAVFLMRINRLDQAIAQFERVKAIAGPGTPVSEQADRLIEAIRQTQGSAARPNG